MSVMRRRILILRFGEKDWHAFCAGDSIVVGRGCDPNCEIELRAVFGPCDIYCTVDEPRAT